MTQREHTQIHTGVDLLVAADATAYVGEISETVEVDGLSVILTTRVEASAAARP
ncbi:MAG: hypothetical protein ACI9C1_001800 [Candidatus Aldehydirespiratoraceae bacterium]|jgi:hypothetical protein